MLPTALREAGMQVFTHADLDIPPDEFDVVWIPKVAARGLVILTADRRIRREPLELRAVVSSRAWYFGLSRSDRSAADNAEIILRHRATIEWLVHKRRSVIAQLNAHEVLVRDRKGKLVRVRASERG